MPAPADPFTRGFKVEEVANAGNVEGVVRQRMLNKNEGVKKEMIRKCAAINSRESSRMTGLDLGLIGRVGVFRYFRPGLTGHWGAQVADDFRQL